MYTLSCSSECSDIIEADAIATNPGARSVHVSNNPAPLLRIQSPALPDLHVPPVHANSIAGYLARASSVVEIRVRRAFAETLTSRVCPNTMLIFMAVESGPDIRSTHVDAYESDVWVFIGQYDEQGAPLRGLIATNCARPQTYALQPGVRYLCKCFQPARLRLTRRQSGLSLGRL